MSPKLENRLRNVTCNDQGTSLAEATHQRRLDPAKMLQKCANPGCTVPFRSLHEGRLFLAETLATDSESTFDGNRRRMRKREHFWLCAACSTHFTLHFDASLGMLTVPLSSRAVPAPTRSRTMVAGGY